jgi:hypothetical protein
VQVVEQVTDKEIVFMMIVGTKEKTLRTRICRVERLRTTAGGRRSIEERSDQITEDSRPALTEGEADKVKEQNRYRVDGCVTAEPAEAAVTDADFEQKKANFETQQLFEPSFALGKVSCYLQTQTTTHSCGRARACAKV